MIKLWAVWVRIIFFPFISWQPKKAFRSRRPTNSDYAQNWDCVRENDEARKKESTQFIVTDICGDSIWFLDTIINVMTFWGKKKFPFLLSCVRAKYRKKISKHLNLINDWLCNDLLTMLVISFSFIQFDRIWNTFFPKLATIFVQWFCWFCNFLSLID